MAPTAEAMAEATAMAMAMSEVMGQGTAAQVGTAPVSQMPATGLGGHIDEPETPRTPAVQLMPSLGLQGCPHRLLPLPALPQQPSLLSAKCSQPAARLISQPAARLISHLPVSASNLQVQAS